MGGSILYGVVTNVYDREAVVARKECVSRLEFITSSPSISATVMHGSNQISKDGVVQSLKELASKPAEQWQKLKEMTL